MIKRCLLKNRKLVSIKSHVVKHFNKKARKYFFGSQLKKAGEFFIVANNILLPTISHSTSENNLFAYFSDLLRENIPPCSCIGLSSILSKLSDLPSQITTRSHFNALTILYVAVDLETIWHGIIGIAESSKTDLPIIFEPAKYFSKILLAHWWCSKCVVD